MMRPASTEWKEVIAADETARFARQGELIRQAHAVKNRRYGKGRFLHRKEILGAQAKLEVYADLPDHARFGVFKTPGTVPAIVRLSNGAFDIQANTRPDIRGFALKILDQSGDAALGGNADHQDFLLINHESFASRDSDEFVEFVGLSAKGQLSALWTLFRRYGIASTVARLKTLIAVLGKPFPGYASETFNTAVPHRIGPYAAKILLVPQNPRPMNGKDAQADLMSKLAEGPLSYELCLHFYTDDRATPLEDHRTTWDRHASPPLAVARLTLTAPGSDVENLSFDPWGGLEDHRPLGEIMRARKSAYYLSQKARLS